MALSSDINKYIEDSKINGRFCKWDKNVIHVFVTQITANISDKAFLYSEIERAISVWNKALKENNIQIIFNRINTPLNADVVIHWTKVGRVFEGMCKYPSIINGIFKKIIIDIGLPNEYSGKNTIDDAMFVPHKKNIAIPSKNDIYVLQLIYS